MNPKMKESGSSNIDLPRHLESDYPIDYVFYLFGQQDIGLLGFEMYRFWKKDTKCFPCMVSKVLQIVAYDS